MREMFVLSYIPTADGLGFRDEVRMGDTASTKTFELTIELKLQRSEEAPSTGNWRDGDVEVSWVIPRSDLLKSPLPMAVLHLGRDPRTESISPTLLEIEAAGGELLDGIRWQCRADAGRVRDEPAAHAAGRLLRCAFRPDAG